MANLLFLVLTTFQGAHHSSNVHQSKEWVAGPNGYLYQFHAGDQSWLAAREFCLSQNSDLVVLRDAEQIDWLLSHYAPTYARFAERYIQVGLMIPDGPSRDWMYLDGSKYNQSVISWMSGEPFDHSTDGLERCALLRIHARVLDDVDCEATTRNQMPVRFICERSSKRHKQQQLSKNFLWGKLEQIFELLGFGSTTPAKKVNTTDANGEDYVEEETTEPSKIEESTNEVSTTSESSSERLEKETSTSATPVRAHAVPLREIPETEGSGTTVEENHIEKVSIRKGQPYKFVRIQNRAFQPTTDIKPPGDDDCDEEGSGATTQSNVIDTEDVDDLSQKPKIPVGKEQHIEDFLRTLRTFLSRAQHSDLRKLLDNDPDKSLLEKMKLAISAANDREYARLRELALMKKHGVDISNVRIKRTLPKKMRESEREDLFKKISGVVMEEAEKNELEAATEPSARTTTQEKSGSTTTAEEHELEHENSLESGTVKSPISAEHDNSSDGSDKGNGQSEESTTAKHEEPKEEKPKEDKANDDQDKELTTTSAPPVTVEDDDAVEVGTEKTPEAKKAQRKVSKEVKEEEDSSEEDNRDSTNPLGLPTLPPPPTLAPLPSLETVLENLGMQWRKLFTPPKVL
ncbi:unnamed protein product [Haemonchus placei]|uniref:C-type lectin domain-containing protein n=1 Tax=Haemonchus placei TaxID=6290 RepID=A0A158QR29_HAEPC|nr:unnamed protein product [Haemonchus placei]